MLHITIMYWGMIMEETKKEKIGKKRMKIVVDDGKGPKSIIDEEICCDTDDSFGDNVEKIIAISGRGNVVMTRLSDEDNSIIDALVNLEAYTSKSEAVAHFVHVGLEKKKDMISKVMPYVKKIKKLKEEAKSSMEK